MLVIKKKNPPNFTVSTCKNLPWPHLHEPLQRRLAASCWRISAGLVETCSSFGACWRCCGYATRFHKQQQDGYGGPGAALQAVRIEFRQSEIPFLNARICEFWTTDHSGSARRRRMKNESSILRWTGQDGERLLVREDAGCVTTQSTQRVSSCRWVPVLWMVAHGRISILACAKGTQ